MKLLKKPFDERTELAETAIELTESQQAQVAKQEAAYAFGGIQALMTAGRFLTASAIRAIDAMKEQNIHIQCGYSRFDLFLDKSPLSPMGSDKYYRQKQLLQAEGENTFDALNRLGIPLSTRRQLGSGTIEVDGNDVLIGNERIPITDAERIKQMLKDQADANVRLTRDLDEGRRQMTVKEKEIKELKQQFTETIKETNRLNEQITELSNQLYDPDVASPVQSVSTIERELGLLFVVCGRVEQAAKLLTQNEKETLQPQIMREFNRIENRLHHALGLIDDQELMLNDMLTKGEFTQ